MTMLRVGAVAFVWALIGGASSHADMQPTWQCGTEYWLSEPVIENGLFRAAMAVDCEITNAGGGGVAALEQYLTGLVLQAETVHVEPRAATYQELQGTVTEVTIKDSQSDMRVRQHVYIVSNRVEKLTYAGIASAVTGLSSSDLIRRLDDLFDVEGDPSQGHYKVRLSNVLHVQKPWYAPTGVFRSQVLSTGREQFLRNRNRTMPRLAAHL